MITFGKHKPREFHEHFDPGNFTNPYNEFNGIDSNKD